MENHNEEPSNAPEPNRWYNLTLGPSLLNDDHSPRFCTLQYDSKPASIDNTQPGTMHKSKDNKVTLEFQNNQPGKSKVSFTGVNKDYTDKDKEAVLFFDGETFRLEKLHRAVKQVKCKRVPGESAVTKPASRATMTVPSTSKPVPCIDAINNPASLDHDPHSSAPNPNFYESNDNDDDANHNDGQEETTSTKEYQSSGLNIDINLQDPGEIEYEDDDFADVNITDDEEPYKGLNAAEVLRAQINAEAREDPASSRSSRESRTSKSGIESTSCSSRG